MGPVESSNRTRVLVLALGNDLLGDDGVGLVVARRVRERAEAEPPLCRVDVVPCAQSGLALLEYLVGYDRVVIVDAMKTGRHSAGAVVVLGESDFRRVVAPSAHYAGLPEVLELGRRLELTMPSEVAVVAVEVSNPYDFSPELSPEVAEAVPEAVDRVWSLAVHGACAERPTSATR